jgi:hypothetical protein
MRRLVSAVRSMLLARSKSRPGPAVMVPAVLEPERRRRQDRRIANIGSPTGVERRTGRDRRVAELALGAILAPRPGIAEYQIRP